VAYPDWELVVLDDRSGDATPRILRDAAISNPRLRVVEGTLPPDGWGGKNWACHKLSDIATGGLLLFADADVRPAPGALLASVALLERENGDALTGFGRQISSDWSSRAVVPLVMEIPVVAFLSLREALERPEPVFSAAVGQWLLFRRETYEAIGGHRSVASRVVEDIILGAAVKRSGRRLVPALARDFLEVEMYRGLEEVWNGFAKNISTLGGGGLSGFLLVQGPGIFLYILPWILPFFGPSGWIPLALLVALRLGSGAIWRTNPVRILLHPAGSLLFLAIGVRSALIPIRPVAWKGRIPCKSNATPS
jgi:chlorobactene glucosyltransferase